MLEPNDTSRNHNSEPTVVTTALKPMRFQDILDTTFSLYRKHFLLFLGLVAFFCPIRTCITSFGRFF